MRKNSCWIGVAGIVITAGCTRGPETVYVSIDRVLASEKVPAPSTLNLPKPPQPAAAVTVVVPAEPARILRDPANNPTLNLTDMFKSEQDRAYGELRKRLRQFYESEVQRFQLEQEGSLAGSERKGYEEANVKIRPLFEKWADNRAPIFARLAFLAGFPDPNPTSKPASRPLRGEDKRKFDEEMSLRAKLKTLDDDFRSQCNALFSAVLDQTSAAQAALRLRIEEFASELDKRAEVEARSQIRNAVSHLNFRLAAPSPTYLTAIPARSITIPGGLPLKPIPRVPSEGILDGAEDRRRLLRNELKIWLALNRFRLAESPKGARDATYEFQIWRQQHGAGP